MTTALPLGTFARAGDFVDVQFDRFYPHPIDKVWRARLTYEALQDQYVAAYELSGARLGHCDA